MIKTLPSKAEHAVQSLVWKLRSHTSVVKKKKTKQNIKQKLYSKNPIKTLNMVHIPRNFFKKIAILDTKDCRTVPFTNFTSFKSCQIDKNHMQLKDRWTNLGKFLRKKRNRFS